MSDKRLRVVGWNVQPVVLVDDGDLLTPLQVPAELIPAAEWENFKNGLDAKGIESLREQLDETEPVVSQD